jgi:uncharacterized protein (TIGR03083 family)
MNASDGLGIPDLGSPDGNLVVVPHTVTILSGMIGVPLSPGAALAYLEAAANRFSTALDAGDLAVPVPSCPGWDLRALAAHLGGVHRWARSALTRARPDEQSDDGPGRGVDLRAWFDDGARELLATLRAADPAAPCWTFGPEPRTAAFWFRRQAQETSMHAWDAEQAASGAAGALPLELALDGVDEVATMFVPRQIRLGRLAPLPHVVDLRASDAPTAPACRLGSSDRGPDAVVSAPAATLLLLLWRRVGLHAPGVRIDGDAGVVQALLAAPLTP